MGEVFPSIYQTTKDGTDGSEWVPRIDSSEYLTWLSIVIKHIWGAKRLYDSGFVRQLIVELTFEALIRYGEHDSRYVKLFTECETIYNLD